MLIRDLKTADASGIVENSQMAGYPGVAVVLIFVDQSRARPGPGRAPGGPGVE